VKRRGVMLSGLDQRLHAAMTRRLVLAGDKIASDTKTLEVSYLRLNTAITRILQQRQASLATKGGLLEALSYKATLDRGFAVVRTDKGALVRTAAGMKADARLTITLHDGDIKVRIGDGPIQGSLF
jgi:exodeoxyribonuclease VII large subunit